MLVLSRQRNETIMIGDEIEITIVDIKGDKVRVGISAPRSVAVHRKEVYLAIKEENLRAQEATTALDATQLGALFGPGAFSGIAKPATPPAKKERPDTEPG